MSLASGIQALAQAIGNFLRDNVLPRLIPSGGSAGQVLQKVSPTDYHVGWATLAGGGGGATQVFIGPTQPADTGQPYIWIQTGLPNDGISFWFNESGTT